MIAKRSSQPGGPWQAGAGRYNIVAAGAVDREFLCIYASFELALKCQGVLCCSLGLSLGRLGAPLGCLGPHFGPPGNALGCLGEPWARCWHVWGSFWNSGVRRNPHRKPMALKYRACAQKQASWNLPGGPGETVHELQFRSYLPHAPGIRMT